MDIFTCTVNLPRNKEMVQKDTKCLENLDFRVLFNIFIVKWTPVVTILYHSMCWYGIWSTKNNFITSILYFQIAHPELWKVDIFEIELCPFYHKICAEA